MVALYILLIIHFDPVRFFAAVGRRDVYGKAAARHRFRAPMTGCRYYLAQPQVLGSKCWWLRERSA